MCLTAISVQIVMPHFNEGASSSFYQRYGALGHSPGGILATMFTDPGKVLSTVFDGEGVHYLLDLFVPLLLLVVAAPVVLVAAIPELGLNLLSATHTQSSIHHHYTAGLIPPLIVATVLGAARLTRSRPGLRVPLAMTLVVVMVGANYVLGAVPGWRGLPGGQAYQAYAAHVGDARPDHGPCAPADPGRRRGQRDELARLAPVRGEGGSSASRTSGRAMGGGRRDPARLRGPLGSARDRRGAVRLRRNPNWRLVFSDDGVLVFKRTTSSR